MNESSGAYGVRGKIYTTLPTVMLTNNKLINDILKWLLRFYLNTANAYVQITVVTISNCLQSIPKLYRNKKQTSLD